MKAKGKTSQRTILFRQNIDRSNEEWAHFLEGYRKWLMDWDMLEFGDDWHTAEDVVSEIYLSIIEEPLIVNLRPQDTFRHTLIILCKHAHSEVTKPWRKGLVRKLCDALRLSQKTRGDLLVEMALGFVDLVEGDLMDRTRDGKRPFRTFSKVDLKRWRKLHAAGADAKATDIAKSMKIDKSSFSRSCAKVDDHVVETVREIMERRGVK